MKGSACRSLFRSGPETPTRKWWLDGSLTFRPPPLVRVGLPGGSAILKVPRSFWNALSPCGMFANLTYYWKPFRVMPGAETSVIGDQRDSSAPGMGTSLASLLRQPKVTAASSATVKLEARSLDHFDVGFRFFHRLDILRAEVGSAEFDHNLVQPAGEGTAPGNLRLPAFRYLPRCRGSHRPRRGTEWFAGFCPVVRQ
jgi:hypothetical protein